MNKKIFFVVSFVITMNLPLFSMSNNNWTEELIVKDNKMVMFRDGSVKKDYFFPIDKIVLVEKDSKSVPIKYNVGLIGGKTIVIYKLENYRRLMQVYLDMKPDYTSKTKTTNTNNYPSAIKNNGIKPYINNTEQEQKEIEKMNINTQEQIIALDPLDIKESN